MKLLIILIVVLLRRGPQPSAVVKMDVLLKGLLSKAVSVSQPLALSELVRFFLLLVIPLVALYAVSYLLMQNSLQLIWYVLEFGLLFFVLSNSKGEDALEEYRVATSCRQQATTAKVMNDWYNIQASDKTAHTSFMRAVCSDWHAFFVFPLFWYFLLGAPALLLIVLLSWFEQCNNENLKDMAKSFKIALKWPSSRLLALSLGVAGNLTAALSQAIQAVTPPESTVDDAAGNYVAAVAVKAMGLDSFALSVDENGESAIDEAAEQAASLHGLVMRTMWVWLVVVAVLLVFIV